MSEIKQIDTGVAELLAVKVPEGIKTFAVELDALFCHKEKNVFTVLRLPKDNWTPLGLSTELTEEQCRAIMPEPMVSSKGSLGFMVSEMDTEIYSTAKEAFASLMQANGCYSVNPLGEKPKRVMDKAPFGFEGTLESLNRLTDTLIEKWQQAEANTGTWLILKRLS